MERMYTAGQVNTSKGCYLHKSVERSSEKEKKLDGVKRGNHHFLYRVLLEADFRKSSGIACKLILFGLEVLQ